jgi:hypothetical protein
LKFAILCSFVLGSASVAYGQTRMPPPTYNNGNSGSNGWDNPQTRNPTSGTDPADRVGTFQIMLQAPPVVSDTTQIDRGFGLKSAGALFGYVGISGAVGYTLSSLFEIGGGIQFGVQGVAGGSDYQFLAEPFVKLNLGPTLKTGALNPFALVGVAVGVVGTPSNPGFDGFGGGGGGASGALSFELDPGLEWLVGGRWGFDFYIPVQIGVPLAGGDVGITLGVAYGIVAYL